jgi:hypothetical protein
VKAKKERQWETERAIVKAKKERQWEFERAIVKAKKERQLEIEGCKRDCECKGRETMGD